MGVIVLEKPDKVLAVNMGHNANIRDKHYAHDKQLNRRSDHADVKPKTKYLPLIAFCLLGALIVGEPIEWADYGATLMIFLDVFLLRHRGT